jgi:hypothetical protein
MLKDNQGRKVVVRYTDISFWAETDTLTLEQVEEATICNGAEVFLSSEYLRNALNQAGYDWVGFTLLHSDQYNAFEVKLESGWSNSWTCDKRWYKICDRTVDETTFNAFAEIYDSLNAYKYLLCGRIYMNKGSLDVQTILEIIGEGNIVTPSSLKEGHTKDGSRLRLGIGDIVEITDKKGVDVGTILKMSKKATVLRKNGQKSTIEYSRLQRTDKVGYDKGIVKALEPTIKENLDYVVLHGRHRLYRAKTEKRNVSFPMFPEPDEKQIVQENVQSCTCPLCGWLMAVQNTYDSKTYSCCFCKVQGIVIHQGENEVTLLMNRWPAKNRFAIKEVRCCSNCGLFCFESGRQGKRSTGYCRTTNQCVQGFNTCKYWFPIDSDRYSSAMRQHVTNLGYGVNDNRNTSRNDIRDTIYREEDHEKEKQRAETAKTAYIQAYSKFMSELTKLATEAPLHEATLDENTVFSWKAVLDDGC